MVAHRQVLPVGHQRIVWSSEHDAHIGGMLQAAVEVGIIRYTNRHVHGHLCMVMECLGRFNKGLAAGITEYVHQLSSQVAYSLSAQRKQGVQGVLPKVFNGHTFDDMPFRQCQQINYRIPYPSTRPGGMCLIRENAEWDVLNGKI